MYRRVFFVVMKVEETESRPFVSVTGEYGVVLKTVNYYQAMLIVRVVIFVGVVVRGLQRLVCTKVSIGVV